MSWSQLRTIRARREQSTRSIARARYSSAAWRLGRRSSFGISFYPPTLNQGWRIWFVALPTPTGSIHLITAAPRWVRGLREKLPRSCLGLQVDSGAGQGVCTRGLTRYPIPRLRRRLRGRILETVWRRWMPAKDQGRAGGIACRALCLRARAEVRLREQPGCFRPAIHGSTGPVRSTGFILHRVSLSFHGFSPREDLLQPRERVQGHPFLYYANGAACSEVGGGDTADLRINRVLRYRHSG